MLKRRLSEDPKAVRDGVATSTGAKGCPDIWELDDGSFLVIGTDQTEALRQLDGEGIYLDEHERMIVIPRRTLLSARKNIPTE